MATLNTKESVVDLMKSLGLDSSYENRAKIAKEMGVKNYTGSEEQNIAMHSFISEGKSSQQADGDAWYAQNQKDYQEKYVNKGNNTTTNTQGSTSTFTESSATTDAKKANDEAANAYKDFVNVDNIYSPEVQAGMNSTFSKPSIVTETEKWLESERVKIQSGKTSYSDDVKAMIDKIKNREKFSYDVDNDQLFQQALASAMGSGKQAMQDTIGQASALTGGYGSTYATSAGNQAYNAFIEDAYNNLPQYYQMAFDAYQVEGQDMYNMLSMLSTEDAKEYERMLSAYNVTLDYRNQAYTEAYNIYRDNKSDAFAMAQLQLDEFNSKADALYNNYTIANDAYTTSYQHDFDEWQSTIDQIYRYDVLAQEDYWNQQDMEERKRQHDEDMDYKYEALNYEKERNSKADSRYISENDFNGDGIVNAEDERARARFEQGDLDFDGVISDDERAYLNELKGNNNSGKRTTTIILNEQTGESEDVVIDDIPKNIVDKARSFTNNAMLENYLDAQEANGTLTKGEARYLYSTLRIDDEVPLNERIWTMTNDGGNNGGGGIDKNGAVRDQYGNEYTLEELLKELKKTMNDSEAEAYVLNLQKQIGITKK